MIASLKGYSRIARTVLTVLAALLILGIAGSIWMAFRARNQAEDQVVSQASTIADKSLSLVFQPADLSEPVTSQRAAELSDQVRAVVLDPSEFEDVTLMSPSGEILYSTKLSLIGTDLPGEKARLKEALRGIPQTADVDGVFSAMVPLTLASGVGEPAAVVLERQDDPIVNAAGPWKTNALFLFALLVLLSVAVFGVARVLSVVSRGEPSPGLTRPQPIQAQAPRSMSVPQPGMREESEARRRAEDRARVAEERLLVLQEQYQKALAELQAAEHTKREPIRVPDPRMEDRALRAEGQLASLQQQIQTLGAEREALARELHQTRLRDGEPDPSLEARALLAEREAAAARTELEAAMRELTIARREMESLRSHPGPGGDSLSELEAVTADLRTTRDQLHVAQTQLRDSSTELDDARIELRALRNEEQRATMLESEMRSLRAELESANASHRAELVEREAELEEKVRSAREEFQRQLADLESSYRGQLNKREAELSGRISTAETDADSAARELETTRMAMEAARAEAESREQRLIQAAAEIAEQRARIAQLEDEVKERTAAIAQTRKESDDMRRSQVGLQADIQRADAAVAGMRAELDRERAGAREAHETAEAVTRERSALTERVDKLARMLEAAAAENAELNRRLQDFEARRQLELAEDEGRTRIDDLLRVTQERLAGQTEKLIAAEDRTRSLEADLELSRERLELVEADLRTHQMQEALREIRGTDGDHHPQHVAEAAEQPFEDRRASTPFTRELSAEAKKSLSRISGIAQLLKHQTGGKEQGQLLKQLATHAKRLDATVSDLAEADRLARGEIELQPRRTDLEALVSRVVAESEIEVDHEVRLIVAPVSLAVDPYRLEQTLAGLLRNAGERTPNGKQIVVRLQSKDEGIELSVEDPEPASDAALSPVLRRLAEIQGGTASVQGRESGGAAFTVYVPDATSIPARVEPQAVEADADAPDTAGDDVQIVVDPPPQPVEPSPEQILSQELRRLAEAESAASAPAPRRRGRGR